MPLVSPAEADRGPSTACSLPAQPCSCLPAPRLTLLLLLPPSPRSWGLSEQGVATPITQALPLQLAPALPNSQLPLPHQLVTSFFPPQCFSPQTVFPSGSAAIHLGSQYSFLLQRQASAFPGSLFLSFSFLWSLSHLRSSTEKQPSPEHP